MTQKGARSVSDLLSTGALNVALRAATLASKFVLVLLIARYLTPGEFGVYGLVTVTVTLSLNVIGFDFYVFSSREMLARPDTDRAAMVRDQLVFHACMYVFALPLLLSVFFLHLIPWSVLLWFYALVVLEHLSQEAYRVLITFSRPIAANALLFLRSGAWIYAVGALMWWSRGARRLEWIWGGWVLGVGASLVLAAWFLRSLDWKEAAGRPVDWPWIRAGLVRGGSFLLATFAMKGIETIDRYLLKAFRDEAAVGVYSLYFSIANVVYVFVFAGVVSSFHPLLLKEQQADERRAQLRRFALWLTLSTVAVAVAVAAGFDVVLWLVDKPAYAQDVAAFYVLVGSACLLTLNTVPHYALYARHRDRALIVATVLAFAVTVAAHLLLVPSMGILGSAVATAVGTGALLVFKGALAALDKST